MLFLYTHQTSGVCAGVCACNRTHQIPGPPMRPSNNLENKNTSDTYWRVQLIVQAHSTLEQPLEYNEEQTLFDKSRFVMTFITIFGVTEILSEWSRLEFLEKFLANNFVSSDAKDNTSAMLTRGGRADLSLLRTLLAIRQNSQGPSFWEVMDSFVLLAYASLVPLRILLQRLLACLNLNFSGNLFCWYKRKKWFLWTKAALQAAENHGDKWGLTWYWRWGIYTSIPTWTHSLNRDKVCQI